MIAVADVVESVRLMEQDEQEFIRRWHGFVGFVRQRLPMETGRMHKSLGDGLMLEFSEPDGCIRAALAMQEWFNEGNQGLPPEQHVHLRIGAHVAEFVADEYDIYGNDVNLTARIATLAGPGEIVISAALRERIHADLDDHVEDLGTCHLKHVKHPVRAYRVARPGRVSQTPTWGNARLLTRASVAVLPFAVEGGNLALGEAVADEVIAALSRSSQLQVISRLSTAVFKDKRATLDEITRHLRTNYILRGHARQHQERVALFAELTDAASGHVVWAHSFKGSIGDLLSADVGMVHDLASSVISGVLSREVERQQGQPLPSLESYTLLLAAIRLMHHLGPHDMERAKAMLEHLVERNRRLPAALGWMVHWHVLRVLQGWSDDIPTEAQQASAHGHAALLADPHCALAICMDGHAQLHLGKNPDGAARRYRQALALDRDDGLAVLLHGELLALRGQGKTGFEATQRALTLFPLEPLRYFYEQTAALAALIAGELGQAMQLAERAVAAQPRFLPAQCTLAMTQALAGQPEVHGTVERLLQLQPRFSIAAYLGQSPAAPQVAQGLADALALAGVPPG